MIIGNNSFARASFRDTPFCKGKLWETFADKTYFQTRNRAISGTMAARELAQIMAVTKPSAGADATRGRKQ